jgi:hypothetical protein
MEVSVRGGFVSLTLLVVGATIAGAGDAPEKLPADQKKGGYADPAATYRTYIEAVRNMDAKAAKLCWAIDDDNKSGALDVIVGMWVSSRQLSQTAVKKFGAEEGSRAILKGLRRDDVADAALDLTMKRLGDGNAEVKISGDTAVLKIKWKESDGVPNAAFGFGVPLSFRKVEGNWKIDANKMTGLKRGADFFAKGTWGPMFRDQVVIMNEAIDGMEKGQLKSAKDLDMFLKDRIEALKKKYDDERKKDNPKGR